MRARALALWLFAAALASCAGTLSSTSLTTTAPNGAPERIPVLVSKPDAIALYPGCTAQLRRRPEAPGPYRPTAPLLILIGEKDDWTPAEPCRQLAEASAAAGYPVRIKIYPDAHHSFDSDRPVRCVEARVNANSPTGRGATTGGNRGAWDDSIREVTAFFGANL